MNNKLLNSNHKMCLHSFTKMINEEMTYCSNCGCISYRNTPLIKPSSFNSQQSIDPMLMFQTSKLNEKQASKIFKGEYDPSYFKARKAGMSRAKLLTQFMQYDRSLLYKAILYMDLIFLKDFIPLELIEHVACICVLFAVQYNECCSHSTLNNLFTYLQTIPNFHQLEILCLQSLNYDLGHLSANDYLLNIFSMGITSYGNIETIKSLYRSCFMFMECIINDVRYLDFSPCDIALSIIKTQCEGSPFFSLSFFSFVYRVNYREGTLMKCTFVLSIIKQFNNKPRPYVLKRNNEKSSSNASCSTIDSMDFKEMNLQVEFDELSKNKGSISY